MTNSYRTDFSRVFLQRWGSGPATQPLYEGLWKAGAISWGQGDAPSIKIPDPNTYGNFLRVGKIPGEPEDPSLTITSRYIMDLSDMLKLAKDGCDHTLHIHIGRCKDPKDFNRGWEKALILEKARVTSYSTDDLGALDPSERAIVNEEVPFTGEDYYEVKPIVLSEHAAAQVVQEIVDIVVCDSKSCGFCGLPSDGCSIVFGITMSAGGSPGLPAEVIYTEDGGSTWGDVTITTLAANEDPDALACVGIYLVVVSVESNSLHYAEIADILDETQVWVEVSTGFVVGGEPRDIFAAGSSFVWIVGAGGYIYFTADVTGGVEVQSAGGVTTQVLNAIHGYDTLNLVAVGAANAVVYTTDGGTTWQSVTGPAVGVVLNTVFMRSETEWWVGTAGGALWYTRDSGQTWTQKTFSGSGSGQVRDIVFITPSVGFMAHDTAAAAGRIFRTIDGGYSWYVLPEGTGSIPTNDKVNALAGCSDVNIIYGGGLAGNAVDGFVVKGT